MIGICTIYSHNLGFEKITEIVQKVFPKGKLTITEKDELNIADLEIKAGLFSSSKKIKITYRQRNLPSYQFPNIDDSPLTSNLKGLYGFVNSLPARNERIKNLFLHKIQTLNCEFSIHQEQGETVGLKSLIQNLANEFDAILFVQPNTIISKGIGQHFLDKNLSLIIDVDGNCEIDDLIVNINSILFDGEKNILQEDQTIRKLNSEKILIEKKIKVNKNLPSIESENEVTLRKPKEIAERVSILAMTNWVAFDGISSEQAIEYLKKYNLWSLVTLKEREFLANPTDERKIIETWKCECIWTLIWSLNKLDNLGFPNELCNLQNIPSEHYPVGQSKDPNSFINSIDSIRSKSEILNTNDLYYRINWACADARINRIQINEVNPSVVYERHYTLNWLINYKGQEWDDVSCDT